MPADMTLPPADAVSLGHDTYWSKVFRGDEWVGLHEWHKEPGSAFYSAGYIAFTGRPTPEWWSPSAPAWEVVSEDPLTLSPSLACGTCPHHGWIRDGIWVPA